MANVASVTKFFPNAKEGFVTTTSGTISAGAATLPLNSVTGYNNGDVVALVVEPGVPANKQVVTGTVDTSGLQLTGCVWTEGTNVPHTTGATVVDYVTATHMAITTKGILAHANYDGTLKTSAVQAALNIGTGGLNGFLPLGYAPNSVTYLGNHSYSWVINGIDLTGTLSPGMRLRTTRTVAAPTQSTSLNGTNQYWSKTAPAGMTFTDDFTVMAHIKLTSYSIGTIISRFNNTSGWSFELTAAGQLRIVGYNGSGGNFRQFNTYQSIPLNKWVHVAATLDMSTPASTIWIDGVAVPIQFVSNGTNPTALVQAGNLEVGSQNGGGGLFPGKIAQAAVFSALLSQATIQNYMNQGLAGTETNLVSAYSFNNTFNDLNVTNGNNLTANGGATATSTDSPFGGQANGTISSTLDYGIVQSATFSTNTTAVIQVPEGCTIPTSGGVASVAYSSNKVPYGFPIDRFKWQVLTVVKVTDTVSFGSINSWTASNAKITVPTGSWNLGYQGPVNFGSSVAGIRSGHLTLADSVPVNTVRSQDLTSVVYLEASVNNLLISLSKNIPYFTSTPAINTIYADITIASGVEQFQVRGNDGAFIITAENAYL